MSEEIGKIDRPPVEEFRAGRKLYFVPLVFTPVQPQPELAGLFEKYWAQVEEHIENLESKLGKVSKVYHELVPMGGDEGSRAIAEFNTGSYGIVRVRLAIGAELLPIESADLLTEFMDWSKCLSVGLQNQKVFDMVWKYYTEAHKKRDEHIAEQISETLKEGEAAVLLMREGHAVQFPQDVQVIYVAPPALDEMKRWLRDREAELQAAQSKAAKEEARE